MSFDVRGGLLSRDAALYGSYRRGVAQRIVERATAHSASIAQRLRHGERGRFEIEYAGVSGTGAKAIIDTLLTMAPLERVSNGRKAWVTP